MILKVLLYFEIMKRIYLEIVFQIKNDFEDIKIFDFFKLIGQLYLMNICICI